MVASRRRSLRNRNIVPWGVSSNLAIGLNFYFVTTLFRCNGISRYFLNCLAILIADWTSPRARPPFLWGLPRLLCVCGFEHVVSCFVIEVDLPELGKPVAGRLP